MYNTIDVNLFQITHKQFSNHIPLPCHITNIQIVSMRCVKNQDS